MVYCLLIPKIQLFSRITLDFPQEINQEYKKNINQY